VPSWTAWEIGMASSALNSRLKKLEHLQRQRESEGPLLCKCTPIQFVEFGQPYEAICARCGRHIWTIIEQVVHSREEVERLRQAD
jgi:hypothetical protein